jgi:4-amino-4-deoxy-L-arabinose transferase-like glycosyltransferase
MLKNLITGKNTPFWLLTFSVVILLTLTRLIQDGMFFDSMMYTCVSHNLSKGIGTFWFPVFSPSYFNSGSPFFLEHPPLVFGIESLFYKILGDSMYVERFYILLIICISAFLIHLLWKTIFKNDVELKRMSWLPILLWITIPSCSWSYSYNMMENTMGLFCLAAVLSSFKAVESGQNRPGLLILSGFFVFLATLSKGVPGLFPLTVPFLYWLTTRKKSFLNTIISSIVILSVPVVIYFILFNIAQSKESLTFYFTHRLLARIQHDPTVSSRFHILIRIVSELIPLIILAGLVILITKIKKYNLHLFSNLNYSAFFMVLGLSASAPLVLTFVQRGFYLVPSFPYLAIGFSIIIVPVIFFASENLNNNPKKHKIFLGLSIVVFIFSLVYLASLKGKTERDKDMLHDVYAIGKEVPENSSITITQDLVAYSVLECYFIRYFNISLYVNDPKEYYMIRKASIVPNEGYEKLKIDTKLYDIYRRK